MIGKQVLTIGAADFLKGSSSSDYATDGGFSPNSSNLNLNARQGIIFATGNIVDASTNVAGRFIASCANTGTGINSNRRNFLDSSANFYSLTGTTITKQKTGTKTYTNGLSDMVAFEGSYYASSATDISKWNGTSTLDESFWTTTLSQTILGSYPHPMLVYHKRLWIADGQYLHWYDGTTAQFDQINMSAGRTIYALGIDPGSGQMLISSRAGIDASINGSFDNFVSLYDGKSAFTSKEVPTNDAVLSFRSVGDTVYCGTSQNISIWNGSGVQAIHRFLNVGYDSAFLPYKNHLANIGNTLYFVDANQIYAYAEVQQASNLYQRAQKVYFPALSALSQDSIGLITDIGSGCLGTYFKAFGTGNDTFYVTDMSAKGSGASLLTNRYEFPRPVQIHKIRVFTTGFNSSSSGGQVLIYNDENSNIALTTVNQMSNTSVTNKYVFDFDYGGYKLQVMQLSVQIGVLGLGIKRVLVYYDVCE